jgi:hypothetical protein
MLLIANDWQVADNFAWANSAPNILATIAKNEGYVDIITLLNIFELNFDSRANRIVASITN